MTAVTDSSQTRRIELILRQVDNLPSSPALAARLMQLAAEDASQSRLLSLIECDPALTARVLATYYQAERPRDMHTISVARAAAALGVETIRNFSLCPPIIGLNQLSDDSAIEPFDSTGHWHHSLSVALCAKAIAEGQEEESLDPETAFTCGLLHDIGKLALRHLLGKAYARTIELTEQSEANIAECERQVLSIDHHTAGKRLAEDWRLPHCLQDCIWLHGSPYNTLPQLKHQRMVGLIGLADVISRKHKLGYSGNHLARLNIDQLALQLNLNPQVVERVSKALPNMLRERLDQIGLSKSDASNQLQYTMHQANQTVGRLNNTLLNQSRAAIQQSKVIETISTFHASAMPGRSTQDVVNTVAASASSVLGTGFYCIVYQPQQVGPERLWMICQYDQDDKPILTQLAEPPAHTPDLARLDPQGPGALNYMGVLPWVVEHFHDAPDVRDIRLLPLSCGWGTAALMLHTCDTLPQWQQLISLTSTWGAAIAAASQHEGARRLGEELAEANSALAEAQDRLLESESMARLGEMAAGAAHEMNNPLAVISGRSQLLARSLSEGSSEQRAAQTIADQSHRLSDLISLLRFFADPPQPERVPTEIDELLHEAVIAAEKRLSESVVKCTIEVEIADDLPKALIDPQQVREALVELIRNSVEALPNTGVRILAEMTGDSNRMRIQVQDDGCGMDAHTLSHAMDPFYSAKPAGRQVGMGLAKAQQYATNHGGKVGLRSSKEQGTVATFDFPLHSAQPVTDM